MKYTLQILLVLFFTRGYSQQSPSPEQILVKLEEQRLKAIQNRDSVTLSSLYDDRYNGVLTTGRQVVKSGVIEFQLASNPHVKISIEDVKASIYGDVGITTGKQVNRSSQELYLVSPSLFVYT